MGPWGRQMSRSMAQEPTKTGPQKRAEAVLLALLPKSAEVIVPKKSSSTVDLVINGQPIEIKWAGKGELGEVRRLLKANQRRPDVVVARRLSPGAKKELSDASVGWADESGAAEISIGPILISRSGLVGRSSEAVTRWTPSVIAVAEALLCGVKGTVKATKSATGLSSGSCTNALGLLTDLELLETTAKRGPSSGRSVLDTRRLLSEYSSAIESSPKQISLQVGVLWRDAARGLAETGSVWTKEGVHWAATGAVAASVLAPYLSSVTSSEVYVEADTIVGLESIAAEVDLSPLEGGRLTLKPFPSVSVQRLSKDVDGLRIAPWPRVYVDLKSLGVRGEEAAEHLLEVLDGRSASK